MSFAKSKNDFSKKDMNFFSEFSSGTSQQISSVFPIFLLLTVLILGITLIVWIVCGVQIMNKQNEIDDIKAYMASADYQKRLSQKDNVQLEVEDLRQYYYVLSTLDARVSDKTMASVDTLKACRNALPDDCVMNLYHDEGGVVEVSGYALNRISILNYAQTLNETGLFTYIEEHDAIADPIDRGYDKDTLMFGNVQYTFHYFCSISGHYTLSWASFVDGTVPTPLTKLVSKSYASGEEYTLDNITSLEVDGVKYTLSNVKINDTAVDKNELQKILTDKKLTGRISGNTDVKLMYTAVESNSNGGES